VTENQTNPADDSCDIVDAAFNLIRNQPIPDGPSEDVFAQTLEALRSADAKQQPRYSRFFDSRITRTKFLARIAASLLLAIGVAVFLSTIGRGNPGQINGSRHLAHVRPGAQHGYAGWLALGNETAPHAVSQYPGQNRDGGRHGE